MLHSSSLICVPKQLAVLQVSPCVSVPDALEATVEELNNCGGSFKKLKLLTDHRQQLTAANMF